jgi:hypothetical protein
MATADPETRVDMCVSHGNRKIDWNALMIETPMRLRSAPLYQLPEGQFIARVDGTSRPKTPAHFGRSKASYLASEP